MATNTFNPFNLYPLHWTQYEVDFHFISTDLFYTNEWMQLTHILHAILLLFHLALICYHIASIYSYIGSGWYYNDGIILFDQWTKVNLIGH